MDWHKNKHFYILQFIVVPSILFTLFTSFIHPTASPIEISISNIRSERGQFVLGIYKDAASFENEKPHQRLVFKKTGIINGVQKITINIEPGIYGISLLDDEDYNNKMNYNFLGLPTEGFGFLNYYHSGFTKPHFDVFKTAIRSSANPSFWIKIRYM